MDLDAPSIVWFVVGGVVVPAAFVAFAFRSPTRRQVTHWAHSCGVTITDGNEAQVRSHLGRVRRYRSVAAFPFWWLYAAPLVLGSDFPTALATPAPALLAYVSGALVAELTTPATGPGRIKQASLSPRESHDYEPSWLRIVPWTLVLVALVVVVVSDPSGPRALAFVLTLTAAGVTVFAEEAARRIARRPQRSGDTDVLAADDALRATAISMTASIAVLAALVAFTAALNAAVPSPSSGTWATLASVASLVSSLLGMGAYFCIMRQETWGYRPRHRQRDVAPIP